MSSLAALFFVVALIYASVGFGGGSTYTALLGLWGVDFKLIPVISLLCNIIVVSGGVWRFQRAGLIDWRRVWPLLAVSVPCAFVGGLIPLKQSLFLLYQKRKTRCQQCTAEDQKKQRLFQRD